MSGREEDRIVEDMTDILDGAYQITQATEEYDSYEAQLNDIEERLERSSADAEEVKEKFYEMKDKYDDSRIVVERFAEALEKERDNKEKWKKRTLFGAIASIFFAGTGGAAMLAASEGDNYETDEFSVNNYEEVRNYVNEVLTERDDLDEGWSPLVNTVEERTIENSDLEFGSLDILNNTDPDKDSYYVANLELPNGRTDEAKKTIPDEDAEKAIEHFRGLDN